MKAFGLFLIVLCCSLEGFSLSAKLSARVRMLEETLSLIQTIRRELILTHASCTRILEQIKGKKDSPFIQAVCQLCKQYPFPQAWRQTAAESLTLLTEEQREVASSIGTILGNGDLRSQEEALQQCEKLLEAFIKSEKENTRTHGKLYGSLGILTGLMAAVILI